MRETEAHGPAVREATVEGIFYPARPAALSAHIAALLAEASRGLPSIVDDVYGLITPHAALGHAGTVFAAAYGCVARRRPTVAVLLGPMHRDAPEAVVLPESAYFRTPLGKVPVAARLLEQLREAAGDPSLFRLDDIPHLEEHCLEVQLPFLQHLFPGLQILPLLVGKPSVRLVELLAETLWWTFSQRAAETLFVATVNLGGQRSGCPEGLVQRILQADWRGIVEQAGRGRACSCGPAAIAAILHLHERRGGPVRLLRQGSSADVGAAPEQAVHYAAFSLADAAH